MKRNCSSKYDLVLPENNKLFYSFDRQVETEILDSVMGPAVYDSRIRPSGINGTGRKTSFSFYVQQWGIESNLFTTSS